MLSMYLSTLLMLSSAVAHSNKAAAFFAVPSSSSFISCSTAEMFWHMSFPAENSA
eukprot:CAMPEP_0181349134 /NCGR_PEP_ID=MMETSP1106-20121128/560_1 /TAXON_ID=81844 /ORGANISM="Mantoniella antarctica, Strain SL-175" /LENGTH=54 /DNA_ID=CAMNT_0023461499 /DNA_START=252 /DNA_END=416 /DNA_ORIENTATION=-